MNPAREYGPAYLPTGKEHDPTRIDSRLWLSAVIGTIVLSAAATFAFSSWCWGHRLSRPLIQRLKKPLSDLQRPVNMQNSQMMRFFGAEHTSGPQLALKKARSSPTTE